MLRSDRILPVVFLAFLGFAYYQTYNISNKDMGLLGPTFWPRMIIITMVVLLIGSVIEDKLKERKEAEEGNPRQGITFAESVRKYSKVIFVFAATIIYILLLNQLGYVVDTILYLICMSLVLKSNWKEKLPFTIGLMVIFTFTMYFIFTNLLEFVLPSARFF